MKKNPDTQGLRQALIAAVVGLLAIAFLLAGIGLFITFYDGSSPSIIQPESVSQAISPVIDEAVDGKDVATGLIVDEGFEMVKANCTGCHSSAIVLQNRFTREGWKAKIVWMQETQGLWDLGPNEAIILDYLAKHHAPTAPAGRRVPLKDIEWYELDN